MGNSQINVVSVDDEQVNLLLIEELASNLDANIHSFLFPLEAFEYIKNNPVDLVLVDYMMPDMDGLTFISNTRELHPDIPIIMITAVASDSKLKLKALEVGATEFLNKPLNMAEFNIRVKNLIELRKSHVFYKKWAGMLEDTVQEKTQAIIKRELETLQVLGKAAEYKDPETANHIVRVSFYSRMLARLCGMDEKTQEMIFYAAPLHDLGKLGIPEAILLKPGKLDDEELKTMKRHPQIGHHILLESSSPYLKLGAEIAMTHHEKYDGSGYPAGLVGEDIPISGRIVAIADVFDALTTKRPYKNPWPIDKAIDLLIKCKGGHFDPKLVDMFVNNLDEVQEILARYNEEE